ncbi:MAG TPA: hypothetical protein VEX86_05015 [Longimicrobium sp.]|nr:hypothetical protein [Longimicrobium sp.]
MDTLEYPYRANTRTILVAMAFFGVCAAVMAHAAVTNDRGLIINGVISLGVDGGTRFYWGVAATAALFVAAGALGLRAGRSNPMVVRLTPTHFSAPKHAFVKEPTSIPLSNVNDIAVTTIHKQRLLTVYHPNGTLSVAQSMLPSSAAFEELHALLAARVRRR